MIQGEGFKRDLLLSIHLSHKYGRNKCFIVVYYNEIIFQQNTSVTHSNCYVVDGAHVGQERYFEDLRDSWNNAPFTHQHTFACAFEHIIVNMKKSIKFLF